MMSGSLFEGLPPPASAAPPLPAATAASSKVRPTPGHAIRPSATPSKRAAGKSDGKDAKQVRFKSNEVEANDEQILGAMAKIASHIANPGKFSKASKLAVQLLEAGSVKPNTVDAFFEILRAAMTSPFQAIDASLWANYHALFSLISGKLECFSPFQRAQIEVWEIWAVLANEFRTDDTFVFSKASSRVRHYMDLLPEANEEDELILHDTDGGITAQSGFEESSERGANNSLLKVGSKRGGKHESNDDIMESDPFGLNALMPRLSKKEERACKKKDEEAATLRAHKNTARLLNEHREALTACIKIAASQYKLQWAQTIIDMLVKHAFDSVNKFTVLQRHTIEQLWGFVREQLVYRKYSKPTFGKLDVTPFEQLQSQYAQEHISIRRAVGSSGDRSAEQWLG